MKKQLSVIVLAMALSPFALAAEPAMANKQSKASTHAHKPAKNGLVTLSSAYSVKETLDRLEDALREKDITIVKRWSHDEKAAKVDIKLRPTELLIFGNPKLGSHLFTSQQISGIDLPLKALAWEDAKGKVWLTYNDPSYIAKRHGIKDRDDIIKKMTQALKNFSSVATSPEPTKK